MSYFKEQVADYLKIINETKLIDVSDMDEKRKEKIPQKQIMNYKDASPKEQRRRNRIYGSDNSENEHQEPKKTEKNKHRIKSSDYDESDSIDEYIKKVRKMGKVRQGSIIGQNKFSNELKRRIGN